MSKNLDTYICSDSYHKIVNKQLYCLIYIFHTEFNKLCELNSQQFILVKSELFLRF